MNRSVVICILKLSKIRTDNLLTKWEKFNISKTTYQRLMKFGMFPYTIILFYFTVYYSIRIFIMADMSKLQTRQNMEITS